MKQMLIRIMERFTKITLNSIHMTVYMYNKNIKFKKPLNVNVNVIRV